MLQDPILAWYDSNRRYLPWRYAPGVTANPYHVLLSEVMLQQTTVITVIDYFDRFIKRWPTLADLAAAPLDDVYHCWQGLGYYSRAKNLHKCANHVVQHFNGTIPNTLEDLITLPGIGPYTAAAIGSIAFEQPAVPVDGNIIRVFSRIFALETPLPALKEEIAELVKDHVPTHRRGDFAQALMDMGATVCKPRSPLCSSCPVQNLCQSYAQGLGDSLPLKLKKPLKPRRYGVIFWYENTAGEVAIRKRPPTGLLANLMEIPGTPWVESPPDLEEVLNDSPSSKIPWILVDQTIKHTFTHFHLELKILKGTGATPLGEGEQTCHPRDFPSHAFPTLMKKVIKACIKQVYP